MDTKIQNKSYRLPVKLTKCFSEWCGKEKGQNISPKAAGALLYYMTLSLEIREECETLAYLDDVPKAINKLKKPTAHKLFKVLATQPEEYALRWSDIEIAGVLKVLYKYKPTQIIEFTAQLIRDALIDHQERLLKDLVAEAKVHAEEQKQKKRPRKSLKNS